MPVKDWRCCKPLSPWNKSLECGRINDHNGQCGEWLVPRDEYYGSADNPAEMLAAIRGIVAAFDHDPNKDALWVVLELRRVLG